MVPGVKSGGHAYIQTGAKDTKFGFSSHDGTYLKAIEQIFKAPGMEFEGIHCHIGSQIFELEAYTTAMTHFVGFAKKLKIRWV